VSVLLRLFTALLAVGVFTAGDGDDAVPGPVWFAPRLFPVVPWFRALDVLEPGEPPVPLIVLPFESVFPAEPLPAPELAAPPAAPPELPPELCARVKDVLPSSRLRITANNLMAIPLCVGETPMADSSDSSGSRDPTRAVRQTGLRCRHPMFARSRFRGRSVGNRRNLARSAVMNSLKGTALIVIGARTFSPLRAPMESSVYPAGSMLGFEFPSFIQRVDGWRSLPVLNTARSWGRDRQEHDISVHMGSDALDHRARRKQFAPNRCREDREAK
jgi:hypothetical protein